MQWTRLARNCVHVWYVLMKNNAWNASKSNCVYFLFSVKILNCDAPRSIANGSWQLVGGSTNSDFPIGSSIVYVCNEDFRLSSGRQEIRVICQEPGLWGGVVPHCVSNSMTNLASFDRHTGVFIVSYDFFYPEQSSAGWHETIPCSSAAGGPQDCSG